MLNRVRLRASLASLVPDIHHMTHQKIPLHTSESVRHGLLLVRWWPTLSRHVWPISTPIAGMQCEEKKVILRLEGSHIAPGGVSPIRTVGIEGWDTVNLAKWDVLLHPGTPTSLLPQFNCPLSRAMRGRKTRFPHRLHFIFQCPLEVSKQAPGLRTKSLKAVTPQLMPSQVCFSLEGLLGEEEGLPGRLRVANNQCHIGAQPHWNYRSHTYTHKLKWDVNRITRLPKSESKTVEKYYQWCWSFFELCNRPPLCGPHYFRIFW